MSAIFGIYNLDNKYVSPSQIEAMSNILSHRGNDRNGIWVNKTVGFGHRMLCTTPESLYEQLPKSIHNDDLVITADARIDNRTDLIKQLGITESKDEVVTDSDIILLAYEKWGENCPEKLLGDFAFAIWDKRRNFLFCARDHFGIKPFYYYATETLFAFATEIKALFCLPEVARKLNEDMVADYLVNNFEDKSATFYKNILRLPSGCSLKVSERNTSKFTYFKLDPDYELSSLSNQEYSEGLREIFTEAVRCRMRSNNPIGSMLSGGLDSSSIACVARNLQLETNKSLPVFSIVYDRIKECDERNFINLTLAQGGFEPHQIPADTHSPIKNLEVISWHTDSPLIGPGFSSTWEVYKSIIKTGIKVIFDGHDGDNAISYGYNYLDELAQSGQWLKLAREARGLHKVYSMTQWEIMKEFFVQYRWRPFLRKYPRAKILQRISRRFSGRKQNSPQNTEFAILSSLVNEDFANRVNLSERYNSAKKSPIMTARTSREYHYNSVTSGGQSFALEQCSALAAAFGIEVRYPFWDKRLIEYCLSLPGDQKCNKGWNRIVMRRAMNKILPSQVCWRKNKTDFTASFIDGVVYDKQERLKKVLVSGVDNDEFFNNKILSEMYHNLNSKPLDSDDLETRTVIREFWGIASLFSWLQHAPN